MSNKQYTVDVLGAGISGLTAAYRLHQLVGEKAHIRVWEKDNGLGGLAGTFEADDFVIEKFYHHLFKRDTALRNLIAELGMEQDLCWEPAATGSYYFQQPYRLSSPIDLLRFKPLPFWSRIKMGLMVLRARRVKQWQALDDKTVRDYIVEMAGEKVYNVVWKPLLDGKFGKYADEVSAAWLWCKLVDRGSSRNKGGFELLGHLKGGLGRVFEGMAKTLKDAGHEIHLGEPIQKLHSTNGKITAIETANQRLDTDAILAGIHTPQLARLLSDEHQTYKKQLNEIAYLANVCLVLVLKKSLSEFYWTNVTDTNSPFVGVIEQTKWTGTEAYAGNHIAYLSAYVPQDEERLTWSSEQLLNFYLPYIKKIFPHFELSNVVKSYTWTAGYTQPIVRVGYRHIVPQMQTPISNMVLATMAQIYPNDRQVSNGVMKAGEAADLLAKQLI